MLYSLICQSSKYEIRPTYAPSVIMEIEASHYQKLQLQQNKILKTVLNLLWWSVVSYTSATRRWN